jgi:hypothetical protein
VDQRRAALRRRARFIREPAEVGGQDRRRDLDAGRRPAQGRISWISFASM